MTITQTENKEIKSFTPPFNFSFPLPSLPKSLPKISPKTTSLSLIYNLIFPKKKQKYKQQLLQQLVQEPNLGELWARGREKLLK